jgi:hypothetical protein
LPKPPRKKICWDVLADDERKALGALIDKASGSIKPPDGGPAPNEDPNWGLTRREQVSREWRERCEWSDHRHSALEDFATEQQTTQNELK